MSAARSLFITGARRGLGFKICDQFHRSGWQIYGSSRNAEKLAHVFHKANIPGQAISLDFSRPLQEFRNDLTQLPSSIDLIVHNASPYDSSTISEMNTESLKHYSAFTTNNFSFFQHALSTLTNKGRLVVIGSIAGEPEMMNNKHTLYSIYKASLAPLVEAFNAEKKMGQSAMLLVLGNMREEVKEKEALTETEVSDKIYEIAQQEKVEQKVLFMAKGDPHRNSKL